MVRSRLKLLLHGSHQRAPIQHLIIGVGDENDIEGYVERIFLSMRDDNGPDPKISAPAAFAVFVQRELFPFWYPLIKC